LIAPGRVGIALPLTTRSASSTDFVRELIDEAVAAERAGFGWCLVPEHRQGPDVATGAPLVLAAAILARTSRIRVATGVLLAAVHHPVHLAESVVGLDHMSHGRFVLGVGAGYQPADLEPFGATRREAARRLEEVLTATRMLLERPVATFTGDHVRFDDVAVRPRPLTVPAPPVWVGAWSQLGIDRAARLADGWIADPIRRTDEVAALAERYRQRCAETGRPAAVTVMREAWVDDDDATAARRFAPVIEPIYRYYRRHGAMDEHEDTAFEALLASRVVCGSAATCAKQVAEIAAATGADNVVLHVRHPTGPVHAEVVERIGALGTALAANPTPTTNQEDSA
jgi:alkanesulfonate monooxygenase SsuD/methylene tetrahydromethanopterin reductase-like flavin-dependent oxidoreductase (luciferase family)